MDILQTSNNVTININKNKFYLFISFAFSSICMLVSYVFFLVEKEKDKQVAIIAQLQQDILALQKTKESLPVVKTGFFSGLDPSLWSVSSISTVLVVIGISISVIYFAGKFDTFITAPFKFIGSSIGSFVQLTKHEYDTDLPKSELILHTQRKVDETGTTVLDYTIKSLKNNSFSQPLDDFIFRLMTPSESERTYSNPSNGTNTTTTSSIDSGFLTNLSISGSEPSNLILKGGSTFRDYANSTAKATTNTNLIENLFAFTNTMQITDALCMLY